jgi:hypothetical protein
LPLASTSLLNSFDSLSLSMAYSLPYPSAGLLAFLGLLLPP